MERILTLADRLEGWWYLGMMTPMFRAVWIRKVALAAGITALLLMGLEGYRWFNSTGDTLDGLSIVALIPFVIALPLLRSPRLASGLVLLGCLLLVVSLFVEFPLFRVWFAPLLALGLFTLALLGMLTGLMMVWTAVFLQAVALSAVGEITLHRIIEALVVDGFVASVIMVVYAFFSEWAKDAYERSQREVDFSVISDRRQQQLLKSLTLEAEGLVGMLELLIQSGDRDRLSMERLVQTSHHLVSVLDTLGNVGGSEDSLLESGSTFTPKALMLDLERTLRPLFAERGVAFSVDHDGLMDQPYTTRKAGIFRALFGVMSNSYLNSEEVRRITVRAQILHPQDDLHTLQLEIEWDNVVLNAEAVKTLFAVIDQEEGVEAALASGLNRNVLLAGRRLKSLGTVIETEDLPGGGSRNTLWIPVEPVALELPEDLSETTRDSTNGFVAEAEQAKATPLAQLLRHVLLVEDDPAQRRALSSMLRTLGASNVNIGASGREALELLETHDPLSLLVSDYLMPGMTGLQLLEKVRARYPDVPVLLCTSLSDRADIELLRRSGANQVMVKPLTVARLEQALLAISDPKDVAHD